MLSVKFLFRKVQIKLESLIPLAIPSQSIENLSLTRSSPVLHSAKADDSNCCKPNVNTTKK